MGRAVISVETQKNKVEIFMAHVMDWKNGKRSPAHSFPLAMASEGESVRIVLIRGGHNIQERMLSMGLTLDDIIEVVQRQNKGAVLISKAGSRYAFGGGMAHKINVMKV